MTPVAGSDLLRRMKISDRLLHISAGGNDGWDLYRKSKALIARGIPVAELTIGEHDVRTDPSILGAMDAAARAGHTGYSFGQGNPNLRESVAKRIAERSGTATNPDNILITPGGQAALFNSHMAACSIGDRALFIDPYYATYPGTIRSVGAVPVTVAALPEHGFQPQASAIAAQADGAASLLINSPNNPTGAVYSRETLDGIARVAKDHDLWLISDEVYDTQVWQGTHISPRSLPDMAERTLVVGSMSKSHAMTGSRCGWICGPEEVIQTLLDLTTNTTYGVAGFVEEAANFALNAGPDLETSVGAPFARRRQIALDLLARQNLVKASPPQGAMYMLLDIRATGLSGEEFGERLLAERRIAVMPGESFGSAGAGHIRVALTIADDDFAAAFAQVLDFAAQIVG